MPTSVQKSCDPLPVTTTLVGVAQTAIGCGIGLLVASKLKPGPRRNIALAAMGLGLLSLVPLLVDVIVREVNRPESERGMRRRLEKIREDSGFADETEVF